MIKSMKDFAGKNTPVLGTWVSLTDANVVEMAKEAGFDYVRIDNEYIPFDYGKITELIRTANNLDMPVFVRVSKMEDITPLIAFGVDGIIVPDCNTVERAREAIARVKYHPVGARGMNPGSRAVRISGLSPDEYLKRANDFVTLTIQIEDVRVADYIDDILSLEGIDMVSSGRGDISQSIGRAGETRHPKVLEMEDLIIQKALQYNKTPAILVFSKEELEAVRKKGVNVFTVGNDEQLLRNALAACARSFR